MPKKENRIQAEILTYLKGDPRSGFAGAGGWWLNFHGGDVFMPRGLPDIIGCYKGFFVAFEVKRPGEKPRKIQDWTLQKLAAAGAKVCVIFDVADARDFIERLDKHD